MVSHDCVAVILEDFTRPEVSKRAAEKSPRVELQLVFHVEVKFAVWPPAWWSCCFAAYKPGGADHARA